MKKITYRFRYLFIALSVAGLASCSNEEAAPETPLRAKIDYTTLTAATPYSKLFVDAGNKSTVDLSKGTNRYKMFQALNTYMSSSISGNKEIDAAVLKNMFSNLNNPFVDSTKLNTSGVQLRNIVAASFSTADAEAVRALIETTFGQLATVSKSVTATGAQGKAGKIGTYLVDAKGVETVQVIQKSLIGALQYDYIGNVLLTKGLDADNKTVVSGKTYTQLEQNWDEAYGLLTLNQIFLEGATDAAKSTKAPESYLGSYVWEYNKTGYPKIYPAFLKGRTAIVNNDKAELKVQADFIKAEFEKAIATSAVGYLKKFTDATTDAARVHAIGEALGFIYSLRFATVNGGTPKFSDDIIVSLSGSANGIWDLTPAKITAASDAIKAKFKL